MAGGFQDSFQSLTQPFLPFSAQRLWESLGESGEVSLANWDSAIDWSEPFKWSDIEAKPLFQRLDLDEILAQEKMLAEGEAQPQTHDPTHAVKGGKKENKGSENNA